MVRYSIQALPHGSLAETTSSTLSESDRLCQEEQSEKDRRILSRAETVLANEIDH